MILEEDGWVIRGCRDVPGGGGGGGGCGRRGKKKKTPGGGGGELNVGGVCWGGGLRGIFTFHRERLLSRI